MRHQAAKCINEAWCFHLGDLPPAHVMRAEGQTWSSVTLPHSWNALDALALEEEHHYTRAVGWYVREFESPAAGQRLWVEFEAASQRASTWCDGVCLGEHAGGYTAFTVELPRQPQGSMPGEPLKLALRVDNRPDPDLIPSDMSDFFLYGGLTRNAWCYTTGLRRLASLRCETEVSVESATLTIRGHLDAQPPRTLRLSARLLSPQGELLSTIEGPVTAESFELSAYIIKQPQLWSPGQAVLYTVEVTLLDGEEAWDVVTERIGLRFFAFPEGGTFLLNGEPLRLHGSHRHEDWAGYASAVPDDLSRQELRLIKEAGFNFVRLGHYPQAQTVLEACDELGLLVWDELPWCRGGIGGERFRAQTQAMLEEMIEQHYNHPSIVMWGLGNELDWESEHPDSSDEKVCAFLQTLNDFAHARDPQRLTALRRFEPGASIVDVYSPSIWSGWYRGRYEDYEAALNEALARHPRMLHIEWGGDSHYGRYSAGEHIGAKIRQESDHAERPGIATGVSGPARGSRDSDWSESYILDLMEWHLQVQLRTPRLVGNAQWAFKDFGTPLRPENPIPYVNQKGLLDRAGRPKALYYLFQSYLATTPMCFIEAPTWSIRTGQLDALQRVRVYSNCPQVTLFVNGRDCGERRRDGTAFPAAGLVWHVPLRLGANELRAVGLAADGQCVEHTISVEYHEAATGPGAAFQWQIQPAKAVGGEEGRQVTIQLVDADEHPLIEDRRRVSFELRGAGRLLACLGIAGGSSVIELANGRASITVLAKEATTLLVRADQLPETLIPIEPGDR